MKWLIDWLEVLVNPMYWLMNHPYNKYWDARLRQLLKTEKFSQITRYTAHLGEQCVWIENHPYASFRPYADGVGSAAKMEIRPSRRTIRYAMERLIEDQINAPLKVVDENIPR